MIKTIIFDLDGTLIDLEHIKAKAYAMAASQMLNQSVDNLRVSEIYQTVVGSSKSEVSSHIARELGLGTQSETLSQLMQSCYHDLLADLKQVRTLERTMVIDLVRDAAAASYGLAIATSSDVATASYVLNALQILSLFSIIVTAEQVVNYKPHPEVYLQVAEQTQSDPNECLVLEDTVVGASSALSAGMHCIAIPTSFTLNQFDQQTVLAKEFIVQDINQLERVVNTILSSHGSPTL